MTRHRLASAIAVLLVLSAGPALSHDTWLIPARFAMRPGSAVTLELTSATRFPEAESVVAADWESLFTTLTVSVRPGR